MRKIVATMALCGLVACSAPAPTPTPASTATATPSTTPIATALGGKIPAAFHGRWALVPADCTSTRGDAKGLMTVAADRLTFYESRASIAKLTVVSPTEVKVTLDFSGEGQTWREETPLILGEDGSALTRTVDGQTLRYERCAA